MQGSILFSGKVDRDAILHLVPPHFTSQVPDSREPQGQGRGHSARVNGRIEPSCSAWDAVCLLVVQRSRQPIVPTWDGAWVCPSVDITGNVAREPFSLLQSRFPTSLHRFEPSSWTTALTGTWPMEHVSRPCFQAGQCVAVLSFSPLVLVRRRRT